MRRLCLFLLPSIIASLRESPLYGKPFVQKYLQTAVKLAKYPYSPKPHNIPHRLKQPGAFIHEPIMQFPPLGWSQWTAGGLHAFAFVDRADDVLFVTIRGTSFNDVGAFSDLKQDYMLYSFPGEVHPVR